MPIMPGNDVTGRLARALQSVIEDELGQKRAYTYCRSMVEKLLAERPDLRPPGARREEVACRIFEVLSDDLVRYPTGRK